MTSSGEESIEISAFISVFVGIRLLGLSEGIGGPCLAILLVFWSRFSYS